ncbi:hypothetical protein BKC07_16860 [Peribacillus simplex]|nr:hypothetical protein BKC07_16860 [Peribacillus simplex]
MIRILKSNFDIIKYKELQNKLLVNVISDIKPHEISNIGLILKDPDSKCIYCVIRDIIMYDENIELLVQEYKVKTYMEITGYYSESKALTNLEDRKEFLDRFYTYIFSNDEAKDFIPRYESLGDLEDLEPSIKNAELYESYIKETLFKEFIDFNSTCSDIFDYSKYIKPIRAEIIVSTKIEVCPYCNESLIHIIDLEPQEIRALADLDHFYLQSKMPLLGLTFNNFIPSCIKCNRALKLQSVAKILNPCNKGFDKKARFALEDPTQLLIKDISEINVFLKIDETSDEYDEILASKNLFKLEEIYNHNSTKKELKRLSRSTKGLVGGGVKNYQHLFDEEDLTFEKVYEGLLEFKVDTTDFINIRYGKLFSDIFSEEYFR